MLLDNKIPIVYSLGKIKPELVIVSLYSVGIVVLDDVMHLENISIPLAVPALLGTTISLILGFRISQSYDRWWEARKIWGAIVNDSRTLVRQVMTFVSSNDLEQDHKVHEDFANAQIAFCFALAKTLRGVDPLTRLGKNFTDSELKAISKENNVPNAILKLHAMRLKNAVDRDMVNGFEVIQIDSTISRLTDHMGKAERIKNTVFPVTYTILVEFLLYLFVMLLPLGMTDYFGYLLSPLLILISVPFFLLEKTAINLQNPFNNNKTDIPIINISKTIEMNLNQMLGKEFEKEESNPEDGSFYVM
ncbi:MAG: bestrophin family protein [Salibacteraceae bacterium]